MPRKILLDADVIGAINRGNKYAADALKKLLASNSKIYMSKQGYEELTSQPGKKIAGIGPDSPKTAIANRKLLSDLGIKIARSGSFGDRATVYVRNAKGPAFSASDQMVLAQAKAIKAEVWSFDRAYRNNVKNVESFGVKVAPESHLPNNPNRTEDYRVARSLMNLKPININEGGKVRPLGKQAVGLRGVRLPNASTAPKAVTQSFVLDTGETSSAKPKLPSRTFGAKGKVVAGGAAIVQAVGGMAQSLGEKKQERNVAKAKEKAMRKVRHITGNNRIATLQKITEIQTDEAILYKYGLGHPQYERFVCWNVNSFKDSAELEGKSPKRVDRLNTTYLGRSKEKKSSCREASPNYELKYYDREVFNNTAGIFSSSIIGNYRPFHTANLDLGENKSKYMEREMTFSKKASIDPFLIIVTCKSITKNEKLHLGNITIEHGGKVIKSKGISTRAFSFKLKYTMVPFMGRSKSDPDPNNPSLRFYLTIEGNTVNYSYNMKSIFHYRPTNNPDKPAGLIEEFYNEKGEKIFLLWVQQPYTTEPKIIPALTSKENVKLMLYNIKKRKINK